MSHPMLRSACKLRQECWQLLHVGPVYQEALPPLQAWEGWQSIRVLDTLHAWMPVDGLHACADTHAERCCLWCAYFG